MAVVLYLGLLYLQDLITYNTASLHLWFTFHFQDKPLQLILIYVTEPDILQQHTTSRKFNPSPVRTTYFLKTYLSLRHTRLFLYLEVTTFQEFPRTKFCVYFTFLPSS